MKIEDRLQAFANQLDVLSGELMATQVALHALIACHPDATVARQAAVAAVEEAIAVSLATHHASDPLIFGLQSTKDLLASPD